MNYFTAFDLYIFYPKNVFDAVTFYQSLSLSRPASLSLSLVSPPSSNPAIIFILPYKGVINSAENN